MLNLVGLPSGIATPFYLFHTKHYGDIPTRTPVTRASMQAVYKEIYNLYSPYNGSTAEKKIYSKKLNNLTKVE